MKQSFMKILLCACMLLITHALFSSQSGVLAQGITVTGTVTDKGEPMPGVNVIIKGTTTGVITDINGKYTITVPSKASELEFSFVGYITAKFAVGDQTQINITLDEDTQEIEEVVVIGYGSARKSDLSTAVSTMKVDQNLKSRPSSFNSLVQGRLSGVTIQASGGDPLATGTISIRGRGSRGKDDDPASGDGILYVVDGVPGAPFNMEDVESVTVLKDAASAAIYGASVGSGGVIVITTKQAKAGKVKVDINVSNSFKAPWQVPSVLTSEEYVKVWADATAAAPGRALPTVADPSKYPYGAVTRTDWLDEVFQTGRLQHYAISLSGGNEKITGFGSVTYDKDDGVVMNTYSQRLGAKLNVDFQIAPWLKAGQRVTFQYSNGQGDINTRSHEGVLIGAVFYPRAATVYEYDINGNPVYDAYNKQLYGGTIPMWAVNQGTSGYGEIRNPVATLKRLRQNRPDSKIYSTSTIEIKPITGLMIKSDFTAALKSKRYENFDSRVPEYGRPSTENSRELSSTWNTNWLWETTATYTKEINKHLISAMAGYTMGYENYRWNASWTYDYAREDKHYTVVENATDWSKKKPEEEIWDESMMSVFGRIGYSYNDRYFMTASLRRDATSKLYTDNNSGIFPAFSGSWKLTSEPFWNTMSAINLIKLRGSWGQIGNSKLVPRYSYNAPLSNTPYPAIYGENMDQEAYGVYQKTIANRSLKWETTEQTGFGLDVMLFRNALSLNVDYFYKTTKDLIEQLPIPSPAGIEEEPYGNIGKVVNKGWEFSANYTKTIKEVSFNIFGNLSTVKSEVKDLGTREYMEHSISVNSLYPLRSTVGQPWYSYYLRQTAGIFQTQADVDNYTYTNPETGVTNKIQPDAQAGDLKFVDYNNDGKINDDDRQYMDSYLPQFSYAFGGNVSYRGVDFSFFFQGISNVKVFNGFKLMGLTGRQQGNNMLSDILDSWNYNPGSGMPRLPLQGDANGNYSNASDFLLEDGSYLRLKNVTLGYTLPKNISKVVGLADGTIRFYLSAENVLTFTKYNGFDPEVGNWGVDGGTYPVARSLSIGINVNF